MEFEVNQIDSEDNSIVEDCEVNNLILKKLQEGLSLAENLESFFLIADSSAERSPKFKESCKIVYLQYREIYNDHIKIKQIKITNQKYKIFLREDRRCKKSKWKKKILKAKVISFNRKNVWLYWTVMGKKFIKLRSYSMKIIFFSFRFVIYLCF